jgi:hypothetical protein
MVYVKRIRLQAYYKQLSDFCERKGVEKCKKYYFTKNLGEKTKNFHSGICDTCPN